MDNILNTSVSLSEKLQKHKKSELMNVDRSTSQKVRNPS